MHDSEICSQTCWNINHFLQDIFHQTMEIDYREYIEKNNSLSSIEELSPHLVTIKNVSLRVQIRDDIYK